MSGKKRIIIDYNKIESLVWQLSESLVAQCGAELIDVEYVKEAGNYYLRLYIDRKPPVDHNLCEQVSELVSTALDKNDPIEQAYFLEISSPGLERPLKRERDFAYFAGNEVTVKLYAPRDGKKEYQGVLIGLQEAGVAVNVDGSELCFPLTETAQVRLKADI